MARVLIGEDNPPLVGKYLPFNPLGTEPTVVTRPDLFILEGAGMHVPYDAVVTDLGYGPGRPSGLDVLADPGVQVLTCAKFLWTGDGDRVGVREHAKRLGAVVLDKAELFTAIVLAMSGGKARLSGGYGVCIYATPGTDQAAVAQQAIRAACLPEERIFFTSDRAFVAGAGMHSGLLIDLSSTYDALDTCVWAVSHGYRKGLVGEEVPYLPVVTRDPYLLGFEVVGRIALFLGRQVSESVGA